MDINVGDKIVAKKSTWIAEEGKVGNVTKVENNFVSFTFDGNPKVNCTMDFDTFNICFEKIEEEIEVPTITEEYIADIMKNSEFEIYTVFNKCTLVSCRLPNGFVIVESSACVNPEDYDVKLGEEICMKKIKDKVWELEAYRLQQFLWEEENDYCPCCCGDCDECEYDNDDKCLSTDLDCDDCDDYTCPYNKN